LHGIYYFVGELREKAVLVQTDEGELSWVKILDSQSLPMSAHVKRIYLHWVNNREDMGLKCFLDDGIAVI
jgi:hypothetical protein